MRRLLAAGVLTLFPCGAFANPAGAPWGAAVPSAPQTCMSCHFDGEAVTDSPLIRLAGLPKGLSPGAVYELSVAFHGPDAKAVGFLLAASGGEFVEEEDDPGLETMDGEIRSIVVKKSGEEPWPIAWRAPEELSEEVVFYLAVNFGNDDASPFGDEIHYRQYTVAPAH